MWSLFVKGSPSYQLNGKVYLFHTAGKNWNMNCVCNIIIIFIVYQKNWKIFRETDG